jgi:hypothetical protein
MRRTTLLIIVALALALVFGLLRPIRVESDAQAGGPRLAPAPSQLVASSTPVRTPVADSAVSQPPARSVIEFDVAMRKLVDLSLRAVDELARRDVAAAQATDVEGAELVKAVLEHVADYEQRALFALTGMERVNDERAAMTRRVLERLLFFGLQKLAALAPSDRRVQLDAFLMALLESLLHDEHVCAVVARLLVDQPYLGAGQEPEILRLIEMVPMHPWLAEPMRRLLATLWRNLEASGVRPRDSLETLALMLKDDPNPARRAAAIERLLLSGDRALVDFVLRDIEEQRDATRAIDLAEAAASKLPAELALDVVRRLRAVAQRPLTLSAIELVRRDAKLVRAAFQELTASQANPELRADLVMGLGCNPSPDNLAVTKAAFDHDPDVQVRCRALLALTGNAGTAYGEQVVTAALADRELCGPGGQHLGVILAALENLAMQGEREVVARLGRQLGERRDLPPDVRSELEQLLERGSTPPRLPGRGRKG